MEAKINKQKNAILAMLSGLEFVKEYSEIKAEQRRKVQEQLEMILEMERKENQTRQMATASSAAIWGTLLVVTATYAIYPDWLENLKRKRRQKQPSMANIEKELAEMKEGIENIPTKEGDAQPKTTPSMPQTDDTIKLGKMVAQQEMIQNLLSDLTDNQNSNYKTSQKRQVLMDVMYADWDNPRVADPNKKTIEIVSLEINQHEHDKLKSVITLKTPQNNEKQPIVSEAINGLFPYKLEFSNFGFYEQFKNDVKAITIDVDDPKSINGHYLRILKTYTTQGALKLIPRHNTIEAQGDAQRKWVDIVEDRQKIHEMGSNIVMFYRHPYQIETSIAYRKVFLEKMYERENTTTPNAKLNLTTLLDNPNITHFGTLKSAQYNIKGISGTIQRALTNNTQKLNNQEFAKLQYYLFQNYPDKLRYLSVLVTSKYEYAIPHPPKPTNKSASFKVLTRLIKTYSLRADILRLEDFIILEYVLAIVYFERLDRQKNMIEELKTLLKPSRISSSGARDRYNLFSFLTDPQTSPAGPYLEDPVTIPLDMKNDKQGMRINDKSYRIHIAIQLLNAVEYTHTWWKSNGDTVKQDEAGEIFRKLGSEILYTWYLYTLGDKMKTYTFTEINIAESNVHPVVKAFAKRQPVTEQAPVTTKLKKTGDANQTHPKRVPENEDEDEGGRRRKLRQRPPYPPVLV